MDSKPTAIVFLREASTLTLESYELSRRNEVANLQKQIRMLVWEMAQALCDAEMARMERERRESRSNDLDGRPALALEETKRGR